MIYEVLQIVTDETNNYLLSQGLQKSVKLDNIALIDSGHSDTQNPMEDSVVLTLLTMKEENTLKNVPNKQIDANGAIVYQNNIINLNLYILFSSNRSTYDKSLKDISKVIEFFQGKRLFTQTNSNYDRDNIAMSGISNFRFIVELCTPSFEELNYIWGTLGGKQYPSALYKLSLIEIERDATVKVSTEISGVGLAHNTSN
jgi:hypothetical protein